MYYRCSTRRRRQKAAAARTRVGDKTFFGHCFADLLCNRLKLILLFVANVLRNERW
jgi:hypothetical protein